MPYNPFFFTDSPTQTESIEALKIAVTEIAKKLGQYDETIERVLNYLKYLDNTVITTVTNKINEMYENGDFNEILEDVSEEFFNNLKTELLGYIDEISDSLEEVKNDNIALLIETNGNFISVTSTNPNQHNYDNDEYDSGAIAQMINIARGYYNNRENNPDGTDGARFCYVQKYTPADKNFNGKTSHYVSDDTDDITALRVNSIALDCSSFVQCVLAGLSYDKLIGSNSAYGSYRPWGSDSTHHFNSMFVRMSHICRDGNNHTYPWAFFPMSYGVRNTGELLEMFTLAGMRVGINPAYVDTTEYPRGTWNFDGVEVGDIVFFDKKHTSDNRYLGADHCAIVVSERDIRSSDIYSEFDDENHRVAHTTPNTLTKVHPMIECTNSGKFILNRVLETTYYRNTAEHNASQAPEQVVAICRPMIRKPQLAKMQEACSELMLIGLTEGTRGDIQDIE